jgi:hypothetical protein
MEEDKQSTSPLPPLKSSALPAWTMGMAMGEVVAAGLIESDPEFAAAIEASGLTMEDFTNVMKGVMVQATKSLGRSADFIKETGDDDGCAGTAIFKQ